MENIYSETKVQNEIISEDEKNRTVMDKLNQTLTDIWIVHVFLYGKISEIIWAKKTKKDMKNYTRLTHTLFPTEINRAAEHTCTYSIVVE